MKKVFGIMAFLLLGAAATTQAQAVKKAEEGIENGAKAVGDKTAQIASKSKAKVTDKRYKDGYGPQGQKVYINNHGKYYWIDKKGHRHYVAKASLKPKS